MAAYRQTVRAEKDLIDIWLSVAADSPAAADMLLDTLDTKARRLADNPDVLPLGILYHNPDAPRYDLMSKAGMEMSAEERLAGLNQALDHFAI